MAKQQSKSFAELRERVNSFTAAKAKAREAVNAQNKEATKLKNAFKAWLEEADLPPTTAVELPDGRYSYTATISETIDPRGWYALWQAGDITEDEFYAALKVGKAPAELAAGADLLANITTKSAGKKRDIRVEDLEHDPDREVIVVPDAGSKKAGIASRPAPPPVDVQPAASPAPAPRSGGTLRKLRIPSHGKR